MSVLDVLDAIEARLSSITGLRVRDVSPGQVTPPQAVIGIGDVPVYHGTHDGSSELDFQLHVFTSAAVDRVGQRLLAEYAAPSGPRSIREVLETDRTLGGAVAGVKVTSFRVLGLREVGLIGYFGGLWTVEVIV